MSRVITLNGRRFAVGLEWKPLKGLPGKEAREEAALLARNTDRRIKYGVLFDLEGRQVAGFARGEGIRATTFSAALVLASRDRMTLVVAQLGDDQYWLCNAGAGKFDPGTDVVLGREAAVELVRDLYTRRVSSGGAGIKIFKTPGTDLGAPSMQAAEELSLEKILATSEPPAGTALELLGGRTPREKLILVAVAASALIFAGQYAYDIHRTRELQRQQQEDAARRLSMAAPAGAERSQAIVTAVRTALAADTATAPPALVYAQCEQLAKQVGRTFAGWTVVSATCDADLGQVQFAVQVRPEIPTNVGTAVTLERGATELGAGVQINPTLKDAVITLPLTLTAMRDPLSDVADLPTMLGAQTALGDLLVRRQRVDPRFTFALTAFGNKQISYLDPEATDPTNGGFKRETVPPDQAYREGQLVINSERPRDVPINALEAPHMRLSRMEIRYSDQRVATTATFLILIRPS